MTDAIWNPTESQYQQKSAKKSISVCPGPLSATGTVTLFTFPGPGTLANAYADVMTALAAAPGSYYTVALQNGTAAVAAALGGTAGLTVGAHPYTVTGATFASGDNVSAVYTLTGAVTPNFSVQLDYQLDNTPGV